MRPKIARKLDWLLLVERGKKAIVWFVLTSCTVGGFALYAFQPETWFALERYAVDAVAVLLIVLMLALVFRKSLGKLFGIDTSISAAETDLPLDLQAPQAQIVSMRKADDKNPG